jgi:proline racemase
VTPGLAWPDRVEVVDSHTEGEPTRVAIEGWPQPEGRTMAERREFLLARQDRLRQAVVCEPRGHDAVVGALLTPPVEPGSAAGVVFFNNAGGLGMCGHGLIGVARTLEHLGRLAPGPVRITRRSARWVPFSSRTARSRSRTSRPSATRATSRWRCRVWAA